MSLCVLLYLCEYCVSVCMFLVFAILWVLLFSHFLIPFSVVSLDRKTEYIERDRDPWIYFLSFCFFFDHNFLQTTTNTHEGPTATNILSSPGIYPLKAPGNSNVTQLHKLSDVGKIILLLGKPWSAASGSLKQPNIPPPEFKMKAHYYISGCFF